jgi:Leucine-rich repeat (LRR) protein
MKNIMPIFFLSLTGYYGLSQEQDFSFRSPVETPLFRSKKDSTEYHQVSQALQRGLRGQANNESVDSLFKLMRQVSERTVIGSHKTYTPSPSFFPFDSLSFLDDYSKITKLSISRSTSTKLPAVVLQCKNLESLELIHTRFSRLPKELRDLSKLKSVYVLNNQPSKRLKLGKNGTVENLVIHGNQPQQLPRSFKKFTNLKRLDLSHHSLASFPKGTSQNKKLKELILSNNAITLAGDKIKPHYALEKLEMQRNKISTVPASIQSFPNLKRLTLNNNSIERVDGAIGRLSHLEQLSFYRNNLKSIPEGVYQISSLKEIDLYYNQIERLDKEATNWVNLEILYLANNKLLALPDDIGKLSRLVELYLHNNRLSVLPETVATLEHLKVLRINNNYLSQLPEGLLNHQGLENLDLSNNQITRLPSTLFDSHRIKLLVLVQNPYDIETQESLPKWAEKLRARQAVVHLDAAQANGGR